MCTIACDNCFELTGSATRTCQDDGTWTGNEAQCMKGIIAIHVLYISQA